MLEWTFRFNVKVGMVGKLRDWVNANEAGLREHTPPGWAYLGTWFSVRGFGDYDGELRYSVESYAALGAGLGDDEYQRLQREMFDFIDYSTRPHACLYRPASSIHIPKGM